MKFQVIGKNIKLTDAIKGHLDNKINKIFPNADESTGVRISLCVKKIAILLTLLLKQMGLRCMHAMRQKTSIHRWTVF